MIYVRVIPAKAGIHCNRIDSRLRGNDRKECGNDRKEYKNYGRKECENYRGECKNDKAKKR